MLPGILFPVLSATCPWEVENKALRLLVAL